MSDPKCWGEFFNEKNRHLWRASLDSLGQFAPKALLSMSSTTAFLTCCHSGLSSGGWLRFNTSWRALYFLSGALLRSASTLLRQQQQQRVQLPACPGPGGFESRVISLLDPVTGKLRAVRPRGEMGARRHCGKFPWKLAGLRQLLGKTVFRIGRELSEWM